jgi:hypothetical protein
VYCVQKHVYPYVVFKVVAHTFVHTKTMSLKGATVQSAKDIFTKESVQQRDREDFRTKKYQVDFLKKRDVQP